MGKSRNLDQLIMGGVGVILGILSWSLSTLYDRIDRDFVATMERITVFERDLHAAERQIAALEAKTGK